MPGPTYVTDGAWGTGTGVPHTANEADTIIYDLDVRITYLEDNPSEPNQIVNVTQSGGVVTFWMADSTTFAVTLPTVAYYGAPVGADIADDVYTPVMEDRGKYFRVTGGSTAGDCLITIPPDNEVAFPTGTELHFHQATTYPVIFVEGSNTDQTVTFNPVDGFDYVTRGRGAVVTVKKVALNAWDIFGALEATTS